MSHESAPYMTEIMNLFHKYTHTHTHIILEREKGQEGAEGKGEREFQAGWMPAWRPKRGLISQL